MTIRNLLLCLSASAVALAFASSPAYAQNAAITACASKSGALRLIFAGSSCKNNESPVSWSSTIAIGVNGLGTTRTVTVANLGDVTVSCSGAGAATVGFNTSDPVQYREDRTTVNGETQTLLGSGSFGNSYTVGVGGEIILLSLHNAGGAWKIEFMARSRQPFAAAPGFFDCSSAAIVTVLQ